jgi:glycosyltransferase involved in cell wall biosynthesis
MPQPLQNPRRQIALYYPWLYLTSGAERTILRLVEHSRHDWVIITNRFDRDKTYPGFANLNVVELDAVSVDRTLLATAKSCLRLLTQKLPVENAQALVVVCEGLGDLVLFRNKLPALCLCLTPLRIAFDETYQQRWTAQSGSLKALLVRAGSAVFRAVDRLAWRRYSKLFCISGEVRRRIVKGGLAIESEIEIIHPALGFQPKIPDPRYGDFFLLPGRIMWTKNIELGIDAFRLLRRRFPEFRLIVAGMVDHKSAPYLKRLKLMNVEGVEFCFSPSDRELGDLYRNCRATLFTAFNEDYGIVPLEGMAFGKPCIAVNRGGPLDTIVHGVNGFLEEPEPAAFAARMADLAASTELCNNMGCTAIVHAQKFNWIDFANRIDNELESLVSPDTSFHQSKSELIAKHF